MYVKLLDVKFLDLAKQDRTTIILNIILHMAVEWNWLGKGCKLQSLI